MADQIGKRIGDYEILGALGAGGMGQVFKVRNVISDRIEAMKILLPNLEGRQELADRFLREIKLLASLDHPNIAALRTALTVENRLVMIMEFVEGVSLASRLEQGPLTPGEAVNYTTQALNGLGYAHQHKIIHRDIKPANMMLTPTGVIKIMDFGIAYGGGDHSLTATGATLGSLYYMSPEQVSGQPTDERSDLYSVGVSLYEMATGKRPFQGDSEFSVMAAHLQQAPRPPIEWRAGLPAGLNEIILIALAKDPAQRFQTADAFKMALSNVQGAPSVLTSTYEGIPTRPPGIETAPPAVSVAAAVAASAGTGGQAQATPAAMLPQAVTVPHTGPQHRGLYVTLGALLVLAVLVAAGVYMPKYTKAKEGNAAAVSPRPAPTTSSAGNTDSSAMPPATLASPMDTTMPSASGGSGGTSAGSPNANLEPAGAGANGGALSPSASVKPPKPSGNNAGSAGRQANNAVATGSSQTDSQPSPAVQPASAPAPAVDAAALETLDHESDQLTGRAGAVDSGLNRLQQAQASQGYGLRGDIVASQTRMHTFLDKAQSALKEQDAARARKYLDQATAEVQHLEQFLGR